MRGCKSVVIIGYLREASVSISGRSQLERSVVAEDVYAAGRGPVECAEMHDPAIGCQVTRVRIDIGQGESGSLYVCESQAPDVERARHSGRHAVFSDELVHCAVGEDVRGVMLVDEHEAVAGGRGSCTCLAELGVGDIEVLAQLALG